MDEEKISKQFELVSEIQGDLQLKDFAELMERSKVEIWRVKNGKRGISKGLARKLSELSGKPLEECLI